MSDVDQSDGGPAFPCAEDHEVAADIPWTCGMSKRELFAAILMHGELVAGGPNSENATRAVESADALLLALGAPPPSDHRELYASEQMQLDAADRLAATLTTIQKLPEYAALPLDLRTRLERDLIDVIDPEIPF